MFNIHERLDNIIISLKLFLKLMVWLCNQMMYLLPNVVLNALTKRHAHRTTIIPD